MAFLQDNRPSREPFINAPAIVLLLIAILVAAHAIRVLLPGDLPDIVVADYAFIPSRYSGAPEFASANLFQQAIPFLSHMFIHGDLSHVGINSLWLLAFGPIVARRLKTTMFLLFFLFCGVAGIVLHLFVYWGSDMAVVGASGAIAGLMGGGMRYVYGGFYGRRLAPILSRRIVGFSAVWAAVNIVGGILRLGATDDVTLIAWVVHLGGYFAGLLAIGFFDRISMRAHAPLNLSRPGGWDDGR